MAMKEGDAWIVDLEANDYVTVSVDEERVTAQWDLGEYGVWRRTEGWSFAGTRAGMLDYLDCVRVDVERMGPGVKIDECQFDYTTKGKDVWV
jgi:hypothetical protein